MRRLTAVLFGVMLGAGGVFAAFRYHVVRAEEGYLFIPRERAALTDSYVDVRDWDAGEWQAHDTLAQDLTAHGRGDLVVRPMAEGIFRRLLDRIDGAVRDEESTERR